MTINRQDVEQKLRFARTRLDELLALNDGSLPGADSDDKHRLIQEYFFHLAGSTEVLAQLVNEHRALGFSIDEVSKSTVLQGLSDSDPIKVALAALNPNTRRDPLPKNPYEEEGLLYRVFNYRHHVTHRGRSPFYYRVGDLPETSLVLDPREDLETRTPSGERLQDELRRMYGLVAEKCQSIIKAL